MNTELDGMAAVMQGVDEQIFPHTMDARVWAKEWMRCPNRQEIANNEDAMITWFANAIMAGYDTASLRASKHKNLNKG